ncbi:MAG TPA: class I SAM-dependent methyltransferase [Segetibacter sp.]
MKLSPLAQNPLEWLALKARLVPTPLAYSHFGFMMSKFLLEAVDKGIFEVIGNRKISLEEICSQCKLETKPVKSLLGVLATMGLIKTVKDRFFLTAKSKKWILKDSPDSLYWLMMFDNRVCLKWMDYVGEFLKTGKGLQYHETLNEEEWMYYQKAMEATASATSKEAVRRIAVPANATQVLDIGGSHGLYSVGLCKRNHAISATILDLPAAVEKAGPILAKYNMGNRVVHQPGNILIDEIGEEKFDLIVMASVAHHFTVEENILVAQKAYKALKPGGLFTILEVLRSDKITYNGDMLSALGDFFFALSSTSGTWSLQEIKDWQKQAGFTNLKKTTFLTIPGYAAITGRKL